MRVLPLEIASSCRLLAACGLVLALGGCRPQSPTQEETLGGLLAGQCAYESLCGTPQALAQCNAQLELGWWGTTPGLTPITGTTVSELDYPVTISNLNSPVALLVAVKAGQVALDNAEAAACMLGLNAAPCSVPPSAKTLHACAAMYVGTIPVGGSCIASPSCVAGSACVPTGGDTAPCAATCQPIPKGTCQSALQCPDEKICVAGKCAAIVPPGAEGEPCGNQVQCNAGLSCQFVCQGEKLVNLCEPLVAEGQTCQEYGSCGGTVWYSNGYCNQADWCVGVTDGKGTCSPPLSLGAHCAVTDECRGGYCSSGMCVPIPSSGPCSPPPLFGCAGNNYCDMTGTPTCRPLKPAGAACSDNRECMHPLVCLDPGNGGTICESAPMPTQTTCSL